MRKLWSVLRQSMKMSVQNIKSNKMRTFLTTLGIIIGVTAVIALITIVNGVIDYVMGEFSSLGAGTLNVTVSGSPLKSGLSEQELAEIEDLDNVAGISPSVDSTSTASRNGNYLDTVAVQGRSDYYFAEGDLIAHGRALTKIDIEQETYVCVIDSDLAESLFPGEDPVGSELTVGGGRYTVVGILGEDDNLMSSMSAANSNADGTVIIPYTNAMKLSGNSRVRSLTVYVADTDQTDALQDELDQLLASDFNGDEDCYSIFSMDSLLDTMNEMMSIMTYMLAGIASIALLVGGIGIMNMMLVSVTERTKEIGLRKAMGATPERIQMQFLLEAVILSLIGGLVGVVLGLVISFAAAYLLGTPFVLSISAVALGVGFSAAVGILFGWTPARKASRLNPIDALRSE
ncbi:MAG: ABC transporter permease [Eubacteriales bacterium]|nr:ABC transporter permease [Eubacteriales bacterium]